MAKKEQDNSDIKCSDIRETTGYYQSVRDEGKNVTPTESDRPSLGIAGRPSPKA